MSDETSQHQKPLNNVTDPAHIDIIGRLVAALLESGDSAKYVGLLREANALLADSNQAMKLEDVQK